MNLQYSQIAGPFDEQLEKLHPFGTPYTGTQDEIERKLKQRQEIERQRDILVAPLRYEYQLLQFQTEKLLKYLTEQREILEKIEN